MKWLAKLLSPAWIVVRFVALVVFVAYGVFLFAFVVFPILIASYVWPSR